MKKIYFSLFALILSALFCNTIVAQDEVQEMKVSITYTWSRIQSHGSNQIAVWIEDPMGNHICTLFATRFTTSGGYVKRPLSLSEWTEKFDLKNSSREEVDAVSGATPQSGKQILIWNGWISLAKLFLPARMLCRWRLISMMLIKCSSGAR